MENTLYMMIATVEAVIPNAVLINASEIPVANAAVSGDPDDIAAKERIIPKTVPISPTRVAIDAQVESTDKFFESIGSSSAVASSNSFFTASIFCSLSSDLSRATLRYFSTPARTTLAKEPFFLSHAAMRCHNYLKPNSP